MLLIDSSSTDELSDESMDNDVQMTSDTASHLKLPGMLTDKLEVEEKVKSVGSISNHDRSTVLGWCWAILTSSGLAEVCIA